MIVTYLIVLFEITYQADSLTIRLLLKMPVCIERITHILRDWEQKHPDQFVWQRNNTSSITLVSSIIPNQPQIFEKTIEVRDPMSLAISVKLSPQLKGTLDSINKARKYLLNLSESTPVKFKENEATGSDTILGIIGAEVSVVCLGNLHDLEIELQKILEELEDTLIKHYETAFCQFCEWGLEPTE